MPTIKMTWEQADAIGLARCRCGHFPNQHFDRYQGCAWCPCKKLRRTIVLPRVANAGRKS